MFIYNKILVCVFWWVFFVVVLFLFLFFSNVRKLYMHVSDRPVLCFTPLFLVSPSQFISIELTFSYS